MPDINNMDFSNIDPESFNEENFDPESLGLMPTIVAASQEIGPEGGSVSVSGTNGIQYTYTIPPGALDDTIVFTIKPVAGMEGAPLTGGLIGAAVIEPVGLDLNEPAILTITPLPGTVIAGGEVLSTFEFYPDGSEFFFTGAYDEADATALAGTPKLAALIPQADGWVMQPWDIPQQRTGPAGTGRTTRSAIRDNAINHPPSNRRSRTIQNSTAQLDDLAPLIPSSYLNMNRISQSLSGWMDTLSLLDETGTRYNNAADKQQALEWMETSIKNVILQFEKNFKRNLQNCVAKDDYDAYFAAQSLKNPRSAFGKIIAERYKKAYGSATIDEVIRKAARCNLKLEIQSTVIVKGQDLLQTLSVTAEVPLKIHYDSTTFSVYYTGSGKIIYNQNSIKADNCTGDFKVQEKSRFVVIKLYPVFSAASTQLRGFNLNDYSTPGITESIRIFCPRYKAVTSLPPGTDIWGGYFFSTRFQNPGITEFEVNTDAPGGNLATASPFDIVNLGNGSIEARSEFTIKVKNQ